VKVKTTINGVVKIELQPETSDEKHVIEMLKGKICSNTTVNKDNGIELTFANVVPTPAKP